MAVRIVPGGLQSFDPSDFTSAASSGSWNVRAKAREEAEARAKAEAKARAREEAAARAREEARQAEENKRIQEELRKKQALERKEAAAQQAQQQIQVLSSGGVKVDKITYVGKAVVPYSGGKTANQLQRETMVKARKQFKDSRIGRGQFSAKIPIDKKVETSTQTLQQGQQRATTFLLGGGVSKRKEINLQPAFNRAGQRIDTAIIKTRKFVFPFVFEEPKTLKETIEGGLKRSKEIGYVKGSLAGGVELFKWGALKPFHILGEGGKKVGTDIQSEGGAVGVWGGAGVKAVSGFVPTTFAEFGTYYAGGKALKYAPGLTKAGITGIGVYGTTQAETPEEYISSGIMIGAGAGGAVLKYSRIGKSLVSPGRAKKIPFEEIKGTPLRQRATVVLKNEKGKILYQIDKPTGTYMLPGGAIEKGELPIKAAQRELFEETGLKNLNLKFKNIISTTEQKHYVYEGVLKKSDITILKPQAKEVTGFKWIKPPKYTGASALQPYGRKPSYFDVFEKRIVRAEDLYIGSKSIYPEIKQTQLVIQKPGEIFLRKGQATYLQKRVGKYSPSRLWGKKPGQFLKFQETPGITVGFGSRYDIPFKQLKKYSGKELWYTHGSRGRIQTELDIVSKGKPKGFKEVDVKETFKVLAGKGKRGEKVLYFQPPTISEPITSKSYLGATYLGLYRKSKPSYGMGVSLKSWDSPQIYRLKAIAEKDLIYTKKAIRGSEFEVKKVYLQHI